MDVNADNRLPASHRFLFLVNSLLLSAAVVYLYSEIFDMNIEENVVVFGAVSVVSAVMLTMACQSRAKKLIARLISKRGIELQVSFGHRNLHLSTARPCETSFWSLQTRAACTWALTRTLPLRLASHPRHLSPWHRLNA